MIVFEEGDYEINAGCIHFVIHVDNEVAYEELEPMLRELERSLNGTEQSGAA